MAFDTKNSILNGYLPSGLYYYFIPAENPIQYSGFLGNAPCVETLPYNPFIYAVIIGEDVAPYIPQLKASEVNASNS